MTTRADLLRLADRVEREEASVELDGCVAAAINEAPGITGRLWRYTSSLDAAASLVPEGALVSVDQHASDWEYCVTLLTGRFLISADEEWYGIAPTEPRARAAAALRARAQEISDE